jgi:oxygen-independent coproporphyrinogen-3 oxidase
MPLPRAAYIHVPFCRHRCGYCNFTLVAGRDDLIAGYLQALEVELRTLQEPREVDTLFLGGGTPTHLPPEQLTELFSLLREWFPLTTGGELSIEANPADLDDVRVNVLAEAGVTRVSIGAQSFDSQKLKRLERDHQANQIEWAVRQGNRFATSVSLDLIFGVPDESVSLWQADLAQVLAWVHTGSPRAEMAPRIDHVSTYGLTFDRGAAFYGRLKRGELHQITEQDERAMYEQAIDMLVAAGFEHYEVSNFALPNKRCRHNETYWLGGEFYAAGPGAARYVGGRREVNHRSTTTYIRRVLAGTSPVAESEELPPEDRARERLVFGLRRLAGVQRNTFAAETGYTVDQLGGVALRNYVAQGFLADDGSAIRLTRAGLLISDALWPAFLRT